MSASPPRPVMSGWEFMAHGYEQIPMHKLEDQRGTIHRAMDVIERFTGKRSVGWLGPGLTQTLETPDLLTEAGVRYIGDWVYDDEPTTIRTAHGPLVTLPYNFETHDIATMVLQHHELPYWVKKCQDTLDRYLAEGVSARRSWRSRCTLTSWASRTGSAILRKPMPTSPAGRGSCT